jgi:beta-lactamase superfamily II metal-dependent hydrolase
VKCGDCISLSFPGSDRRHQIIIDAGYSGTYHKTLGPYLKHLKASGDQIDLFVVTHIDNDHIGGMKPFVKEFGRDEFVQSFWFNWSQYSFSIEESSSRQISVSQGMELRDYLIKERRMQSKNIESGCEYSVGDAKLIVLSPDKDSMKKLQKKWDKVEKIKLEEKRTISAPTFDYHLSIEKLLENPFEEDSTVENGSSIAFIFQCSDFKMLCLADAHPSVICRSLQHLGYSADEPLPVDYVKVSHHGSKANTSPELLHLIDCSNFIISADALNQHKLPNKEALARIAQDHRSKYTDKLLKFWFNYENENTRKIFSEGEMERFGIECIFPSKGNNFLRIEHML